MALTDSKDQYGAVSRLIHWLTALLILVDWPLGLYAHALTEGLASAPSEEQAALVSRTAMLFSVHKTLGVAVFLVSLLRILWALTQRRPGLVNGDHAPAASAAALVHWLLYALLVAVPLTGWIHHAATSGFAPILWPFGQHLPFVPENEAVSSVFSGLHWAFTWLLLITLALHVAGALKHHLFDHDATLRRMWRGTPAHPSEHQPGHAIPAAGALVVLILAVTLGLVTRPTDSDGSNTPTPQLAQVRSDWTVQDGTLALSVTQFGKTVSGSFTDWTAQIAWDDTVPEGKAGHVTVTISIPSMTLGSVTKQALEANFLDGAGHPTATFDADLFRMPEGPVARGTLRLRGKDVPLDFPFQLELADGTATAAADFSLDRRAFGIGDNMPDEKTVAFPVQVHFELTAQHGAGT
ncbi:cytochrome b/b6 domain-containing protein [Pseudooceanicola sp. CBS1P-1]|uniref:Cytochrome n=1 Tax=Pseudooceanicola albus TaxID=2692189 RepID=A0A6L7GAW6_9RHOB|nr:MULTISPECIES: cytochrome b/b6 domain-containing protein [Pseudooceanicola]MBT9384240.1 cytochrome b/b6 domain-containing protein [Pseudooceanicola endophyticus]MXN20832.1 cytochrome [Pseudooceanicola albus]